MATNKFKFGTKTPSKLYMGDTEITKAYMGETLVYEKGSSGGETWVFNDTFPRQFPKKSEYYTEGDIHGLTPTSDYGYFINFIWKDEYSEYNCNYIYNYNYDAGTTIGVATYPDGPMHYFNGSMTITGGTDATNVDFLAWLQANATKQ